MALLVLFGAVIAGGDTVAPDGTCSADGYGCGPIETVVWTSGSDEEPTFPDSLILQPDEVSQITKTVLKLRKGDKGYHKSCGWSEWYTAYDNNDDVILVSVDNFLTPKKARAMRRAALEATWEKAEIHKSKLAGAAEDIRKGNGFPGMRVDAEASEDTLIRTCLRPILQHIDPEFPGYNELREVQTLYGLVTNKLQPQGVWLDAQKMPHNDIKWHYGVHSDDEVARSYASVFPLTKDFNTSGTAIFREKVTGKSLLRYVSDNNEAQGNINPHYEHRKHKELNLHDVIKDPHPHTLENQADNPWVQIIAIAYCRFNRFTFYDGRRLHNQYFEADDYDRLSAEPEEGRLTMNTFLWEGVGDN